MISTNYSDFLVDTYVIICVLYLRVWGFSYCKGNKKLVNKVIFSWISYKKQDTKLFLNPTSV